MAVARVTKEEIRLMVEKMDGSILVVTVPEGCKVTFGAFQPGGVDKYGQSQSKGNGALRIYEGGEGVQLACIPDVKRYQALDKLKVERYNGDGLEVETEETWASQSKIGQLGQVGVKSANAGMQILANGNMATKYHHQCQSCGSVWESINPAPKCGPCHNAHASFQKVVTTI